MRFVHWLLLLPFALCSAATIPATKTRALSGNEFTLPRDLRGEALLILGFTQKSAAATREWREALDPFCVAKISTFCLQMPILESVPRLFRGMVLSNINKQVPQTLKDSFLPVFEKEDDWKHTVDFSQPDDAYILLVSRSGEIKWRTQGPPSEQKLRELREKTATVNR